MAERIGEARKVALSLLDTLEESDAPINSVLMKAKRLARLMRDTDAQLWLDFEVNGYPAAFSFKTLGTCQKYAISAGRLNTETSKYYMYSLPELEAKTQLDVAFLESLKTTKIPTSAKDFTEKHATEALMANNLQVQRARTKTFLENTKCFASLKASIHAYVSDTYLAIELGDVAEDIFEAARNDVDTFVRSHCPKAAEKLIAINDRMSEGSLESLSAALTSCRRLLMDVADSVFPAQSDDWEDSNGKLRKVGVEQYKNRLLAYLSDATKSTSSFEIFESQLEHLASRLDTIYDKVSKGVHVDVSKQEARLAVIHTYLFVGEIAGKYADANDKNIG